MTSGPTGTRHENDSARPLVVIHYGTIEAAGRRGGGIHNAVLAQAMGLLANGVRPVILTASEACAQDAAAHGLDVHLHRLWHSGIDPLVRPAAWHVARALSPAAVIHNSGRSWLAGAALFPRSIHAQVMHRETVRPYRFFRKWIALSPAYADHLRASPSGRGRRIAVAPNGLIDKPPPLPPRQRDLSRPIVFGTAGRLSVAKGIDTLIAAAARLKRDGVRFEIRMAGEGFEPFVALAKREGVGNDIVFLGRIDDMDAFFDDLDVFVLPSTKEAFGLVMIEAMVRGVPVLSTRTHGGLAIVRPGETGWLVDVGDVAGLAEAMTARTVDRRQTATFGTAAYRDVVTRFSPKPAGAALIEALRSLGAKLPAAET